MNSGPHAGWFRTRLAGAGLLEMGTDERASRVWRARGGRRVRRMAVGAGAALTVVCAGAGVALSAMPVDVQVSMTATTYDIGGATLRAVAPDVYTGNGALVLTHKGNDLLAGSSASINGGLWLGSCEVASDGVTETCRLQTGTRTVTARDVWSGGVWHRTYNDGQRVEIASARSVPVPFPVGR